MILDFLDHLETVRGNSARTRNARLAAIHSFMRYAAIRDPASLPVTDTGAGDPGQAVRPARARLPDPGASHGDPRRARPADLERAARRGPTGRGLQHRCPSLRAHRPARQDVLVDRQSALHLHGKGRKQRVIPLWKTTAAELRAWLDQISADHPDAGVPEPRPGSR